MSRLYNNVNLFSDGHYSLPYWCFMMDIDKLYLDTSNNIVCVLEDKYNFKSKNLGNILAKPTDRNYSIDYKNNKKGYDKRTCLLDFCETTKTSLILYEEMSNTWVYVDNNDNFHFNYINNKYKIEDRLAQYRLLDSANKIYIERRRKKNVAIMYLKNQIEPSIITQLSNFYKTYEVEIQGEIIYISDKDEKYKIETTSDWVDVYKKLNLL